MTAPVQSSERRCLEILKIRLLSEGMRFAPEAMELVSGGSTERLSIHEYPTTGGLTMVLDEHVFVNAPFDEWYCDRATTELVVDGGDLLLVTPEDHFTVRLVLPLPGYLDRLDSRGRPVSEVAMSHADRVRLSPIVGCAYNCGFCDLPNEAYVIRPAEQLLGALQIAAEDLELPATHVLISGGSPRKTHYDRFVEICAQVASSSPLPTEVMFSPMINNVDVVDRLVDAGVSGFAINLELYSPEAARNALRDKFSVARNFFEGTVQRAVDRLGSGGKVRSLIIPGLESPEETLAGVEYLASLGCDPVLSPFRPAAGTRLVGLPPVAPEDLLGILDESRRIVARYGVALGPTCVPCQHNTLTFPWDVRPKAGIDVGPGDGTAERS